MASFSPVFPVLLLFCFLLFVLSLSILIPANCKEDHEAWKAKFPSSKMPKFLSRRISALSPEKLSDLCRDARLSCNPNAHFSNASLPLYLQNTGASALRDVYFKKSDVQVGKTIVVPNLHRDTQSRPFLPHSLATKLPFSSKELPNLLNMLNISSTSTLAMYMQNTLSSCEKVEKKQTKSCVTSMEEMVAFVHGKVGSNLHILQTSWAPTLSHSEMRVTDMVLKGSPKSHNAIVCSDTVFPYSVFDCREVQNVRHMEVALRAEGSERKLKGVLQCSTVKWHVIEAVTFVPLLRGEEEEVCHWMSDRDLVFLSREELGKKNKMTQKKEKKTKIQKVKKNEEKTVN